MNAKLITALLGLLTVSSASASLEAATADGSLPADSITQCSLPVASAAGLELRNNVRKKSCQTQLNIQELLKIPADDTATLDAMCDNVACTAALKALYPVLPDCIYEDWVFKRTVGAELKYCGIDPASLVEDTDDGNATTSGTGSDAKEAPTTKPPANWTESSSFGDGDDFAPIGVTPSPTTQEPAQVPSPARRSDTNKPRPPTPERPSVGAPPGANQEVRDGQQTSRIPVTVTVVAIVLSVVLLVAIVGLVVRRRRHTNAKRHFQALDSPVPKPKPGRRDDLIPTSGNESTVTKGTDDSSHGSWYEPFTRLDGDNLAPLLQALLTWRINTSDLTDVALIGSGSQGAIYLVKLGANRLLVSKRIIHDQLTERRLKSLIAEVELVATLHHPSIVTFVGVTWSTPFDLQALFEYMPNGDLRTYLDKNAPSRSEPWTTTKLKMALAVAQGLAYVHSFNPPIVHRDLKARNILLDKKLAAKISDFGVSRLQSDDGTMTTGVGTSRWLAPEVIVGGGRYTEQCDIYSFGVLLVEMDTHALPLAAETGSLSELMLLRRVVRAELRPNVSPSCDPRIAALVKWCLQQDPLERPNALALGFALRQLIKAWETQ